MIVDAQDEKLCFETELLNFDEWVRGKRLGSKIFGALLQAQDVILLVDF